MRYHIPLVGNPSFDVPLRTKYITAFGDACSMSEVSTFDCFYQEWQAACADAVKIAEMCQPDGVGPGSRGPQRDVPEWTPHRACARPALLPVEHELQPFQVHPGRTSPSNQPLEPRAPASGPTATQVRYHHCGILHRTGMKRRQRRSGQVRSLARAVPSLFCGYVSHNNPPAEEVKQLNSSQAYPP